MYIRNDYLDRDLFISPHARSRWNERAGGTFQNLVDRLKVALPFGAQIGSDRLLLEHDGLVFAVSNHSYVATVMTTEQATANVQASCKMRFKKMKQRRNRKK